MTFKEAMEYYRAGTATEEQRQLVEQELEKSQLIAEFLDDQWDEKVSVPVAPIEEMKQVRQTLRRRNVLIVLTSLVLVAALLLATIYIGIPAAESRYWDPNSTSYGTAYSTDLELMLAAYDELFCPDINIIHAGAHKNGFANYDVLVQYLNAYRGGDTNFAIGKVEKGELTLPIGLLRNCAVNIFDRATYPFFDANKERQQDIYEKLSALPEYITIHAAVSFPEDKSMEEVLQFQNALIEGQVGWTAIRTSHLEEQVLPLCGMDIFQQGTSRAEVNAVYPCFDTKGMEITAETLETHFKSLLQFSAAQKEDNTGLAEAYYWNYNYAGWLNYVEENGIYSYGCFVTGSPETFLALIESGAVSQVWIEDIWISV